MTDREALCRCGALSVRCAGEPVRISVCHCLDCQRRSGSAFAAQARFPQDRVAVTGNYREWTQLADSGNRFTSRFCPACGATISYVISSAPDMVAVPLGAFADPDFPAPAFSV